MPPSCSVKQLLLVARHGTRNPSSGDITKHVNLQTKLAANPPTNPKYAFLAKLTIPTPPGANAGLLTLQGVKDHAALAGRLAANYPPSLFADPSTISWQATNVSRAIASGTSFIDGLYASDDDPAKRQSAKAALLAAVVPQTLDADLRPFDACAAYVNASAAAKKSNTNDAKFAAAFFPAIAARLTAATGAPVNLTSDDVATLFSLCSFDNTLQGRGDDAAASPCGLFEDDELALYDMQQDLGNDVNEGFALPVNSVLACSLATTLLAHMDAMVAQESGACVAAADANATAATAVLRFAHEESLMPLVTLFGLFDRQVLGFNASAPVAAVVAAAAARSLHYARAVPFAANFLFELLACGGGGDYGAGAAAKWAVRVLLNEVPIVVPGCPAEVCPLDAFKAVLGAAVGCDFDGAVCGNAQGTVGGAATYRTLAQAPLASVKAAAGA
ncbi:histidine phosphatase superfamily [Zopfochytrium polystomum]|nr:histidine phosphatase superfamily [Zopfochytrium polystomum]